MTKYENYTPSELEQIARSEQNQLALEIIKRIDNKEWSYRKIALKYVTEEES